MPESFERVFVTCPLSPTNRNRSADESTFVMKISTVVLLLGAVLFVLPVPGTFILGGLVLLVGGVTRFLGE